MLGDVWGKNREGDVEGKCGLKEAREGGAERISEARQKPSAAEGAAAFHPHPP